jgi:hypothetical protein
MFPVDISASDEELKDLTENIGGGLVGEIPIEVSLFKHSQSIEPKELNLFDSQDNSIVEDQQEEYNNAQKEIYTETLNKLDGLQREQEVSVNATKSPGPSNEHYGGAISSEV